MKKLLYILAALLMASSCAFFEMDNYEGPDATVTGRIIDAKTGENVPVECKFGNFFGGAYMGSPTEGYFSVIEKGWEAEAAQYWHIKYDGTYANTMVYSGEYDISATANNFYPVEKKGLKFEKGDNTLDWEVTPYARIIDPKVELVGGKFVATFKCEFGDASKANTIYDAKLLCYPDAFVGIYCNNCAQDPGATSKTIVADGKTVNTLTIDPANTLNYNQFKYKNREHFFRIAVCAEGPGHNTGRHYNYCPTIKIKY
jgi:hypothetical protein